jgi:thiosulfate/3-mercaptopyruvate sulfurtransferase
MRALFTALVLAAALVGGATAVEPAAPVLVTPAWLAEHLSDPSLVVLQVAALRSDYDREHIPGARFVWLGWLAESSPEGSFDLPPARLLRERLERLGLSADSRIVICHSLGDVSGGARVFVTLDHAGLGDRTSILDGGLEGWKAQGCPLSTTEPRVARGRLPRTLPARAVVGLDYVTGCYREPGVRLVDGRPKPLFDSAALGGVLRGGHILGAVSLPAAALTDSTDRYLPADSLRARFERAGVRPGEHLIAYCQIGRSAAPVYVAARILGYDVRLYDGSYEQWSRRLDLPVEGRSAK